MLLFESRFHDAIVRGEVTLTFRKWDKPKVKPGGRYRCHPIGVLRVDATARVLLGEVGEDDARRAGFDDPAALVAYLARFGATPDTEVTRVTFVHEGDGDRSELALDDRLSEADVAALSKRLAALDARGRTGPWTAATLALIVARPRVAASRLARELGRETAPFKADVVKLKKLGLTMSFEVGYEVSPRGRALLAARSAGSA